MQHAGLEVGYISRLRLLSEAHSLLAVARVAQLHGRQEGLGAQQQPDGDEAKVLGLAELLKAAGELVHAEPPVGVRGALLHGEAVDLLDDGDGDEDEVVGLEHALLALVQQGQGGGVVRQRLEVREGGGDLGVGALVLSRRRESGCGLVISR